MPPHTNWNHREADSHRPMLDVDCGEVTRGGAAEDVVAVVREGQRAKRADLR